MSLAFAEVPVIIKASALPLRRIANSPALV
jgi:hypothetical protein